jgi:hypothetical protein
MKSRSEIEQSLTVTWAMRTSKLQRNQEQFLKKLPTTWSKTGKRLSHSIPCHTLQKKRKTSFLQVNERG